MFRFLAHVLLALALVVGLLGARRPGAARRPD